MEKVERIPLTEERWAELAQASYDRQKAELDTIRERMEK